MVARKKKVTKKAMPKKRARRPSSGALIDKLYDIDKEISALNKQIDELKKKRTEIHNKLLDNFDKSELTGAMGKVAKLKVDTVTEPTITDFIALFRWASRTRNYSVFQSRLKSGFIKELWDDGKKPDGVGKFDRIRFSLTKR